MELYIGGISQGKLNYVCNKKGISKDSADICDGAVCSADELLSKPIINHFHRFIERLLQEEAGITRNEPENEPDCGLRSYFLLEQAHGREAKSIEEALAEKLIAENPSAVIICNEVGYGIVPIDRADRIYRETVGRCLCRLAEYSGTVERIVCGLGMRIG